MTLSIMPTGALKAMYDAADREYELYLTRQCERAAQARVARERRRVPVVMRGVLACQWVALDGLSPRPPRVFRVYDRPSPVPRPALWSRWGQ